MCKCSAWFKNLLSVAAVETCMHTNVYYFLTSITSVSVFVFRAEDVEQMHQQTDIRSVHVYENQRWNPMTGYTDK